MEIGYYPGCSLQGTSVEYDISIRRTAEALGLELKDVPDWNCCGASSAHNTNHLLAVALSSRVLACAEDAGMDRIVAPCAACSNRLIVAQHEMDEDAAVREKVSNMLDKPYKGSVKVLNMLELFNECIDKIREKTTKKLDNLNVACYYGCLLVRPPKVIQFDDPENPTMMDEIVSAIGAEPVDWEYKVECCGGGLSLAKTELVLRLAHDVLQNAKDTGAQAVVVACPMCHSNLDLRQKAIEEEYGTKFGLPIVFLSELIGAALGVSQSDLGMDKHFVEVPELVGAAVDS